MTAFTLQCNVCDLYEEYPPIGVHTEVDVYITRHKTLGFRCRECGNEVDVGATEEGD